MALKKIRMKNENEGFPITAIREIKILKELDHANIVQLKEIVVSKSGPGDYRREKGGIYMVFEFMNHDLTGLIDCVKGTHYFEEAHIKSYMKQLLEGLHFCHFKRILHRDIKGSNLLINGNGELKLADFGLARLKNPQPDAAYTNRVITLWYRPPELLFGAIHYDTSVDMWSAGCILAELLARKPIFPGRTEVDQIELIVRLCGTPTAETWPGLFAPNRDEVYPWFKLLPQQSYPSHLAEAFSRFPAPALDLIQSLLQLDPSRRMTASDALDHDWFWTDPMPSDPQDLPKHQPNWEYSVRKRNRPSTTSSSSSRDAKQARGSGHSSHSHPDRSSSASSSSSSASSSSSSLHRGEPPEHK